MKRLLIGTTILLLSTSALATSDERTGLYIKLTGGVNKINNTKEKIEDIDLEHKIKSTSKISPIFGVGFGGYLNQNVRMDLTFDYLNVRFKEATKTTAGKIYNEEEDIDVPYSAKYNIARKASIYSLLLNGYIDLPVNNVVSLYAGLGLGVAQIKEKLSLNAIATITGYGSHLENNSDSSKRRLNPAYSLTLGTVFELNPKIKLDVAYSYKDFGKTKYKKDKDGDKATSNHYKGHIVTAAIRFDI